MFPSDDTPSQSSAATHRTCRSDHCEQARGNVYTDDQRLCDDSERHAATSTTIGIAHHSIH